jgi:formylglycine-generating enzyme required for sulfatase activity
LRILYPIKIHCLITLFFALGCSESKDSQAIHDLRGVTFFQMKGDDRIDGEALRKIASVENLTLIQSGEFMMGSPTDEEGREADEIRNKVQISQPFWIKKFEVTRAEWNEYLPESLQVGSLIYPLKGKMIEALCGSSGYLDGNFSINSNTFDDGTEIELIEAVLSPGFWTTAKSPKRYKVYIGKFQNVDTLYQFLKSQKTKAIGRLDQLFPLTHVSYSQAVAFCWEKTQRARLEKKLPSPFVYRLPTEAEWEYACRASTTGVCGIGEGNFLSGENANIDGSMRGYVIDQRPRSEFSTGSSFILTWRQTLLPVRVKAQSYPANAWGVHDMHGSVMEWCYDFYGAYPDGNLTRVDPIGPIRGASRVARGGSFIRTAHQSRSAKRFKYEASYRGSEIGFRYVLGLPLR